MTSLFIGVYRAMYDYEARDELELTLAANDLLYVLEKSDIDEWWTVKKKLPLEAGLDVEEPKGLVPSNYIEPAQVLHTSHALYDYDKQTQEELTFKEGAKFNVFDVSDPDWLLVGLSDGSQYGYVPSNYIEKDNAQGAGSVGSSVAAAANGAAASAVPPANGGDGGKAPVPISAFAPPPQHQSRVAQTPEPPKPEEAIDVEGDNISVKRTEPPRSSRNDAPSDDEDEAPPPMPARPGEASASTPASSSRPQTRQEPSGPQHTVDDGYFRWFISELHRDKKTPVELAVNSHEIIFKRDKDTKLKRGEDYEYSWPIGRLTNYNHEKKHLFLDFDGPTKSLHLYTGDKLVSEAIISILGEFKGAHEARGLGEIARAASAKTSLTNKIIGVLLYKFKSEGANELLADAGEKVYVLQNNRSKDWWLCERMNKKKQGYIPASYIELAGTENMEGMVGSKTKESPMKLFFLRGRLDRDKIRESDRVKRGKQKHTEEENMPNFHRVRTWIDSSGTFKVEAELLGCKEGKIHLHKTNGVKIAVAAAKLSLEDLEYVEKVCEMSLQDYKDEVIKQAARKAKKAKDAAAAASGAGPSVPQKEGTERSGVVRTKSATALINDVSSSRNDTPTRSSSGQVPQNEPDYDWFEFFLNCGVDIGNCQRYSVVFSKEQMDESILEDITPTLLRSLGLREGDILRVTKHLDGKFDRKKPASGETPKSAGGLFTEPTGELKNNSTVETTKVNASALPSPAAKSTELSKIEDDAWAIKPAARSSEEQVKTPSKPQYTGSLHDLIDIKPLEANKSASTPQSTTNASASTPALEPTKTGPVLSQPTQGTSNTQSQGIALQPTASQPLMVMRTGGLVPVSGAGLIPVQPTGFMPITSQPTGFVPIQATGGFAMQATGGFGFVPLQTGATTFVAQKTGPPLPLAPPPTTFGQSFQPTGGFIPLQTGSVTMPALQPMATFNTLQPNASAPQIMPTTSFGMGQPQIGGQATGGAAGSAPAFMGSQATGQMLSNAFVPQSSFGKQITGGFMAANRTGGASNVAVGQFGQVPPQTSFSAQLTGGAPMQTTFNNYATGNQPPITSFGQPQQGMEQMTNMFQNTTIGGTSIGQPPQATFGQPQFGQQPQTQASYGQQPQPTFGQQPQSTFGQQPQPTFGQQPQQTFGQQPQPTFGQQPQPTFGQPTFGQQPNYQQFGQSQNNPGTMPPISFNQMPVQPTSFGNQTYDGFQNAPLQAQPTGLGFGNAPGLQSQPTGKRANLQSATAENPFGF